MKIQGLFFSRSGMQLAPVYLLVIIWLIFLASGCGRNIQKNKYITRQAVIAVENLNVTDVVASHSDIVHVNAVLVAEKKFNEFDNDFVVKNIAPIAVDGIIHINKGNTGVLFASDNDGDRLHYVIVDHPDCGSVKLLDSESGEYEFYPESESFSVTTFSFKANDSREDSNVATVMVVLADNSDENVIVISLLDAITIKSNLNFASVL